MAVAGKHPAPRPRVALIHALEESVAPIRAAFASGWPQAAAFDLLDTSLAPDLARCGRLTPSMVERFVALGRYAAGTDMSSARTAAVLFTCSAFGPAIDAVKCALQIPVLRPNEAAFEEALQIGGRIGLLVSFAPSAAALRAELLEMARQRGVWIDVCTHVVEGALNALKRGDIQTHDRCVAQAAARMPATDALVLGQFSMARAAAAITPRSGCKVITTPASAVARLRTLLEHRVQQLP